ncbi:MAG: DNA-deoxyinosine glycosylase [Spirochaetaceae bacterium]|jgi:hypoxanthine-DNA glycosylase|nr:DNA-deoxyinosine glycosylase [Spirochaetaceae bacterium]
MRSFQQHPFEPIYNKDSRVLILGTLPSPASRQHDFYYSHPRNRFWPVLAALFQTPLPCTKEEKIALILEHNLALWDVLASCMIDGAADISITDTVPHDFSTVLRESAITKIVCTGQKAWTLYQRLCRPHTGIDAHALPSTSPANQRISFDELVLHYRTALTDFSGFSTITH